MQVDAITIGEFIFVRPGADTPRLMSHERIHVAQGRELLYVGFWVLYLVFWLAGLVKTRDPVVAYRLNPFELEARTYTGHPDYLEKRGRWAWRGFL
jgi:hypothetical protein